MKRAGAPKASRGKELVDAKHLGQSESLFDRVQLAEEELSRFFDQSLDMLCIAGFDGYFKRLNPAWKSSLGWTLEELKAKPFLDFVHPEDLTATRAQMATRNRGEDVICFENRYRGKDGIYRWLQWNARSLFDRQLIYATARDITDQKRMEKEILEISDREKERLGRELHDGLCQNLAGIAALSSTLSRKLAPSSEPAAAHAAEITRLLNDTIGHARELARGLNPIGLEEIGLAAALQALASNIQGLFQVSCTFQCDRPFPRLSPKSEAHLYRIAQEAVNNATTHGRGKRIEIGLSFRNGEGLLKIHDNGVGIPEEAFAGKGSGLHTMAYRSHLIGASLQVRRLARRGTAVTCTFRLPLDPPKDERYSRIRR